jgi:hypothetical protein
MFLRRFVFLIVLALLAIAGDAGASFEAIHHEGERCLICASAARPAAKMSSTRNIRPVKETAAKRQVVRKDLVEKIPSDRNLCPTDPPSAAHFRILLI